VSLLVSRPHGLPAAARLFLVLALAAAVPAPVEAQTRAPRPDGLAIGRWFLTPYLFQGLELDDNVFRRPTNTESDRIRRTTLGLGAILPVHNSFFNLDYRADRFDYSKNRFPRDWAQDGSAQMRLLFSTGDRLTLTEHYTLGISDTLAVDAGGELVFQGQPYNLNRWDAELSRAVQRRPGYMIKVSRADLNWETPEGDRTVPFFDYRGFDTRFEYRHPVPPGNWVFAYYEQRRFDHFHPRGYEDPETGLPAWELGVPFRSEESESLQIGLRGLVGRDQPFVGRIGWGRFAYTGLEPTNKDFSGIVGQLQWRLRAGTRSHLELLVNRRPLPSSFPTYYIVNEIRVRADREWLRYSRAGFDLLYSRNRYGEPLPQTTCGDTVRKDNRWSLEAFMDWLVARRFGFRVAAAHFERDSNCPGASYTADTLTAGLTLGWF